MCHYVTKTTQQEHQMVKCELFWYLNGQEYSILNLHGQNQTQEIVDSWMVNISGANQNFVKIRANHGKKIV